MIDWIKGNYKTTVFHFEFSPCSKMARHFIHRSDSRKEEKENVKSILILLSKDLSKFDHQFSFFRRQLYGKRVWEI